MLDVDRRQVSELRRRAGGDIVAQSNPLRPRHRAPDGVARTAQQCPVGGAREQQAPREQRGRADEQRAGVAEQPCKPPAEDVAGKPAVVGAERRQETERRDDEPGPERAHVEQCAAEDHQTSDADQRDRRDVGGLTEEVVQCRVDLLPDEPTLPAEVREAREEEPERGQPEARQLGGQVNAAVAPALGSAPSASAS